MKSVSTLLASLCFALASTAASAATIVYSTVHSGANEVPPNSSPGTGTGSVTVDTTAQTLRYQATWSGLTSNTVGLHLHCCTTTDMNAGIAIDLSAFLGGVPSPDGTVDETFDLTLDATYTDAFRAANGGTAAGAMMALLMGLANGLAYQNIHSVEIPSGELRGNLAAVAAIPLPAAAWLFAAGLGVLAIRRKTIAVA
jgi:hypothetical protein